MLTTRANCLTTSLGWPTNPLLNVSDPEDEIRTYETPPGLFARIHHPSFHSLRKPTKVFRSRCPFIGALFNVATDQLLSDANSSTSSHGKKRKENLAVGLFSSFRPHKSKADRLVPVQRASFFFFATAFFDRNL